MVGNHPKAFRFSRSPQTFKYRFFQNTDRAPTDRLHQTVAGIYQGIYGNFGTLADQLHLAEILLSAVADQMCRFHKYKRSDSHDSQNSGHNIVKSRKNPKQEYHAASQCKGGKHQKTKHLKKAVYAVCPESYQNHHYSSSREKDQDFQPSLSRKQKGNKIENSSRYCPKHHSSACGSAQKNQVHQLQTI